MPIATVKIIGLIIRILHKRSRSQSSCAIIISEAGDVIAADRGIAATFTQCLECVVVHFVVSVPPSVIENNSV